jgi:cytidylate kinase
MKNIWISGSINSGKTTVSKILGERLKKAVIELDSFSEFVASFMKFEDYIRLNYEIVPEIVDIYNKRGLGVIIVYPIMERKNSSLKDTCKDFTFFTIDPGMDIALSDRGNRKLTEWERERIQHHYAHSVNDLTFGTRIDSKNLTPEETAEIIISHINKDQ